MPTSTIVTSNQSTPVFFSANGDQLTVSPGVILSSQSSYAASGSFGVSVTALGSLIGTFLGLYTGLSGQETDLYVGPLGSIAGGDYQGYGGADIDGGHFVTNYGAIVGTGTVTYGLKVTGGGSIANYGSISGAGQQCDGIVVETSDDQEVRNYGTISGTQWSFIDKGDGSIDNIQNAGIMDGGVSLASFSTFDSSTGQVFGDIYTGSGGGQVVLGTNGGNAFGGAGNDNLQANRSATSASAHARFLLDGAGGTNALYGGGAFNTFEAGDANGGHNQIHGGLSQMSDVAGYANNTLDFRNTPSGQSVYVDLFNGHNAYLYANANHTGALTFEDSIQNVPNVVGSAGGDVIQADNGTDVIQGGEGADILYAGTGVDKFVYAGYADSNTVHGYDTIAGFVTGKDKLDLSALNATGSHLAILNGSSSTTLYVENTPGTFNASTDLAISFTGAKAITASDVIF